MSNLQSKLSGVKFEPVPERRVRPPGGGILVFGVFYPALLIGRLLHRFLAMHSSVV